MEHRQPGEGLSVGLVQAVGSVIDHLGQTGDCSQQGVVAAGGPKEPNK